MITQLLTDRQNEIATRLWESEDVTFEELKRLLYDLSLIQGLLVTYKAKIDDIWKTVEKDEEYEIGLKAIQDMRHDIVRMPEEEYFVYSMDTFQLWMFQVELELTGLESHIHMILFLSEHPDL